MSDPLPDFVFVCHAGEIELKAALLAASLRTVFGRTARLVAARPQPLARWGALSPAATEFLLKSGALLWYYESTWDQDYPIGNKIHAANVPCLGVPRVLLDSDILCLRRPDDDWDRGRTIAAKPADLANFPEDGALWERIYGACGVSAPMTTVQTTFDGRVMVPYFNSGVIIIAPEIDLAQEWLACAAIIDRLPAIPNRRPHLDQIALPVAARRLGIEIWPLDESLNYPGHLRRLDRKDLPVFYHYHWLSVLKSDPRTHEFLGQLLRMYPDILEVAKPYPEWWIFLSGLAACY